MATTAVTMPNKSPSLRARLGAASSASSDAEQAEIAELAKKARPRRGLHLGRVSQSDKIFFIDNIATLLAAGMPLSVALQTLAGEARTRTMRRAMNAIKHSIDGGGLFSESLKGHPEIFAPLFISVVEVGEASGTLSEVMARLAQTAKKNKALKSKMVNAMIYPAIVIVAMIAVVMVLMVYVFPQLIPIFDEVQVELPVQTRIMIAIVEFFQGYGLYVLGGLVLIAIVLIVGLRFRPVKKFYHTVFMRLGIIGRVWREVIIVRIVGNLKMLMESGVPIVQALMITSRTAGNLVYEDELHEIRKDVELGKSVHESLRKRPKLFPSLTVSMSKVGEETGKFDEILGKLEEYYQGRVENVFSNLSTIIEPVLLLSIGVAVGFIAVSVIMPIYNLAQAF